MKLGIGGLRSYFSFCISYFKYLNYKTKFKKRGMRLHRECIKAKEVILEAEAAVLKKNE